MEALISENFLRFSHLPFSPSLSPFNFRPFSQYTHPFLHFPHRNQSRNTKVPIFSSISASPTSNSSDFGGWGDLESSQELNQFGELDGFRSFLISIGFDDKKHVFLFLVGFVSALAISRVKFSSVAVFPASVLVFVIGFSIGFVRGGRVDSGGVEFDEKMGNFSNLLRELDAKLSELKNGMEIAIDSQSVEVGEIKRYREIVESVKVKIVPARNLMEASIDDYQESASSNRVWGRNGQMGFFNNVKSYNGEKSSKKRKETGGVGFDFVKFLVGGLFQEIPIGSKPQKSKDGIKRGSMEQLHLNESNRIGGDVMNGSILAGGIEEKSLNPGSNNNIENAKVGSFYQDAFDNTNVHRNQQQEEGRPNDNGGMSSSPKIQPLPVTQLDGPTFKFEKTVVSPEMVRRKLPEMLLNNEKILNNAKSMSIIGKQPKISRQQSYTDDMLSYVDELSRPNKLQFPNKYGSFEGDGVRDPADFGSSRRPNELDSLSAEAKALPQQEQGLEGCDRAYFPSPGQKNGKFTDEEQTYRCDLQHGTVKSMKFEDQPISDNRLSAVDTEVGKMPLSSTISDDEEFNMHMKKATDLLKHARECLTSRVDEETAEIVLYKSASLLSRAIAMKPMSLRAVGQLGNTFLLHGELKLRISRELRTLLSRSDSSSDERGPRVQPPGSKKVVSKDKVASVLADVCEECEQLLVEAGRRYRMALSIDGNDIRALYNWGLALSFRAQLIADIGPEAAVDADKVYLAAIDKFDALMSRSNAYAPDALFRWGIALQQRSRLRPNSSKEKRKLLHQAKRLFEDALRMDSDNVQVREALSSCISELN